MDTSPFVGTLIPLFWTAGDVSFGFQSQSWQTYSQLTDAYMVYIPAELLAASMATELFSSTYLWTDIGGT